MPMPPVLQGGFPAETDIVQQLGGRRSTKLHACHRRSFLPAVAHLHECHHLPFRGTPLLFFHHKLLVQFMKTPCSHRAHAGERPLHKSEGHECSSRLSPSSVGSCEAVNRACS